MIASPDAGADHIAAAMESVSVRYEDHGRSIDIVDALTLQVSAGEIFALVGESGSGKTTAALALSAYARAGARVESGVVRIGDVELLRVHPARRHEFRGRLVAYVPQDPGTALNPSMRVGDQLRAVLAAHRSLSAGEVKDEIGHALQEVGLPVDPSFLRRFPHELSGGQQQRVCVAMAFGCRPKVILMDEPTTGLDVSTQRQLLSLVKRFAVEHATAVVYVTHDLGVVRAIADRVGVLYAGQLVELGHTATVFQSPAHPYTRRLLAATPSIVARRPATPLPGEPPAPGHRHTGCRFAPRCPYAEPECTRTEQVLRGVRTDESHVSEAHEVACRRVHEIPATEPIGHGGVSSRGTGPSQQRSPVLEVRDLRASHGGAQVLSGVDLALKASSCLALVGESGSGKSTTAKCMVGLHSEWTGEIRLEGRPLANDVLQRGQSERTAVQYVFQNPYASLNPRLNIRKTLELPLLLGGVSSSERRKRIREALARVALSERVLALRPDRLSGGERQRVAIARALLSDPRVLVCDEVTSALDVSVQASIIELLMQLKQDSDVAMLFITHNLAVVRALADDVAVLQSGRLVEIGTTEQVFSSPESDYTSQLIRDTMSVDIMGVK